MRKNTKQQKEEAERDALYQRVCDIMAAAQCGDDPEEPDSFFLSLPSLPAVVKAVEIRLLPSDYAEKNLSFLLSTWNAGHYETAQKLTDFLFEHGIRG